MATPVPRPVASAPVKAAPPKSKLTAIKRGQLRSSLRYMFYGPEGVGKSSLLADVPDLLLLDIEGGSENIDFARYPFYPEEPLGHIPRSYSDVVSAVEDLIQNPGHGYAALGIDTADALEALIHRHVCEQHGKSSIEEFGFGKGYQVALDEMRRFLSLLDKLRATGVEILIVGHSIVKTFKNPEGEDYDRYQLRVHDKLGGLVKEWCDVVGFIRFDGGAAKLKGDASQAKRARGWSTGKRIIHLAREAAWDAKSRLSIPAEIELDVAHPWEPFARAKLGARSADTRSLTEAVLAELNRIVPPDAPSQEFTTSSGKKTTREAVLAMCKDADASTLNRILTGLQATNQE